MTKFYVVFLLVVLFILLPFASFLGNILEYFFKDFSIPAAILLVFLCRFVWKQKYVQALVDSTTALLNIELAWGDVNDSEDDDDESFDDACLIATNVIMISGQHIDLLKAGTGNGKLMIKHDHDATNFTSVVAVQDGVLKISLVCGSDAADYAKAVKDILKETFGIGRKYVKVVVSGELSPPDDDDGPTSSDRT